MGPVNGKSYEPEPVKGSGMKNMGLASHTPIRARRMDGHMRLRTVTGPILSDAMPRGSHFPLQDPVRHPANPQGSFFSSRYAPSASLRQHNLFRHQRFDERTAARAYAPRRRARMASNDPASPQLGQYHDPDEESHSIALEESPVFPSYQISSRDHIQTNRPIQAK